VWTPKITMPMLRKRVALVLAAVRELDRVKAFAEGQQKTRPRGLRAGSFKAEATNGSKEAIGSYRQASSNARKEFLPTSPTAESCPTSHRAWGSPLSLLRLHS
jgi:hypothetical protein